MPNRLSLPKNSVLVLLWLLVACGCASYSPRPLPSKISTLEIAELPAHYRQYAQQHRLTPETISLEEGLSLDALKTIALFNNARLKSSQQLVEVQKAQVFNANLLPDPSLTVGVDKPTSPALSLNTGWGFGIGYDIYRLFTRRSDSKRQTSLLKQAQWAQQWQQWQVIQSTQLTAVDIYFTLQKLALVDTRIVSSEQHKAKIRRAVNEGDSSSTTNIPALTSLQVDYSLQNQLRLHLVKQRHYLNDLLGIAPDSEVPIATLPQIPVLSEAQLQHNLSVLSNIRPDLVALKSGYQAQEEKVRAAIWDQFPAISINISRAKDTSAVFTKGLGLDVTFPLLSGNQGNIAIERATRQQLADEYAARLAESRSQADQLLQRQHIILKHKSRLEQALPKLNALVGAAKSALSNGDIDALTFADLSASRFDRQLELIDLTLEQWSCQISLTILLMLPTSESPVPPKNSDARRATIGTAP